MLRVRLQVVTSESAKIKSLGLKEHNYGVGGDGRVKTKALYNVMGIRTDGYKDLLGLYIGESEGRAKFWLSVLTDLQNRGVEDVLIACIDNLSGVFFFTDSLFRCKIGTGYR